MTEMIETYQQDYSTLAMVMNFVGIMLSPAGLFFILIFASGAKNAGAAFKGGFLAEVAEGGIAAGGVYYTHGEIEGAMGFLVGTLIAGVITGAIAASRVGSSK